MAGFSFSLLYLLGTSCWSLRVSVLFLSGWFVFVARWLCGIFGSSYLGLVAAYACTYEIVVGRRPRSFVYSMSCRT